MVDEGGGKKLSGWGSQRWFILFWGNRGGWTEVQGKVVFGTQSARTWVKIAVLAATIHSCSQFEGKKGGFG